MIGLLSELPDDSATTAAMRGGPEWRGWTRQVGLLADVYDALGLLIRSAGRWRRKPPKIAPYPRPTAKRGRAGRRRVTTVADIKRQYLAR